MIKVSVRNALCITTPGIHEICSAEVTLTSASYINSGYPKSKSSITFQRFRLVVSEPSKPHLVVWSTKQPPGVLDRRLLVSQRNLKQERRRHHAVSLPTST